MVPWNMLSKDLQKLLLTIMVLSASASVKGCNPPRPPAVDAAPAPAPWVPKATMTPTLAPGIAPASAILPSAPPNAEPIPLSKAPAMPQAGAKLPLAEIRWIRILWPAPGARNLVFGTESPWPDATYHWSASGGRVIFTDNGVVWEPPAGPGRYVLQVIADWGADGLAMDALVLAVDEQGAVKRV